MQFDLIGRCQSILVLITTVLMGIAATPTGCISEPTKGTVWRTGNRVSIRWDSQDRCTRGVTLVDVDLMVGTGDGVVVRRLGQGISVTEGHLEWQVDDLFGTRSDYFVRLAKPGAITRRSPNIGEITRSPRFVLVATQPKGYIVSNRAPTTRYPKTPLLPLVLLLIIPLYA